MFFKGVFVIQVGIISVFFQECFVSGCDDFTASVGSGMTSDAFIIVVRV